MGWQDTWASCFLVPDGVLLLLVRFSGPTISGVCRIWMAAVNRPTVWQDLCHDMWFGRRTTTTIQVAPGAAKSGRLLRIIIAKSNQAPPCNVCPKQTYSRLRRSRVRDADADALTSMHLLHGLPDYLAGDAVLIQCNSEHIARGLGSALVVVVEPFGVQNAYVSLISTDTTRPLPRAYTLTLTDLERGVTLVLDFRPCNCPGCFETVSLSQLRGSVLVHATPATSQDVVSCRAHFTRSFAPLELDPALKFARRDDVCNRPPVVLY